MPVRLHFLSLFKVPYYAKIHFASSQSVNLGPCFTWFTFFVLLDPQKVCAKTRSLAGS